jgi:predicted AAA+ superfamily ATPase
MWIPRQLSEILTRLAGQRPAVVLTGARQVGKTSLVRMLFGDHAYVSLDLPSEAELADRDPADFLRRYPPPLLVDEMQYAPGLFRHLKLRIDENREAVGQFILTGSQKFPLMRNVSDSLAGRAAIVELEPLALGEIEATRSDLPLDLIVFRGGFPEMYAHAAFDRLSFFSSYVATYIERDLRAIINVTSLRDFERFLRACAIRSGQLLNKADLARDVGISPSTATQWLGLLQTSNQICLLEPWFSNRTKSLTKTPKLYFNDTGLLTYLLNVRTVEDMLASPFWGAIWETFVFAELRKREAFASSVWSIQFLRDRVGEVDFIIDRGGRFELYDAKTATSPRADDARQLERFAGLLGAKHVMRSTLICRAENRYPLTELSDAAPLSELASKQETAR